MPPFHHATHPIVQWCYGAVVKKTPCHHSTISPFHHATSFRVGG
ncbi:MAG TPA: hypothetical protein PKN44_04880 [Bacteroidales bacterium]|nr:hypothetical protein [Bacteroidales bacterium]